MRIGTFVQREAIGSGHLAFPFRHRFRERPRCPDRRYQENRCLEGQTNKLPRLCSIIDIWIRYRFSLRWIIGTGVVLSAVGIGLMGRVAAPWQMFMVYGLVYALGNAGTSNPVVGVMISRWFVRRRGLATSAAVAGSAA